ncbi:5032_t:CDS:2 [Diversispora eburnea]|uniref:5032_t:CDS:1 n=1 Tax=Diversispora eburnea TaxID=1213867 RepID=A0A9N9CE77_9GLOM|nr:5032_t:CDS:2 [Diversispora eburnea]
MNSEELSFTSPPPVNSNPSSSTAKTSSTTAQHLRSSQTSLTTIVKAQISFLLSTLSVDNYVRNVAEINSLLNQHGQDTHFHLLRRLLIDNQTKICNIRSRNSDLSLSYRLLIEKVKEAASDPELSSVFCEAFNSIDHSDSFKDLVLDSFLEHVGINPIEKVGLCISLLPASKKEIAEQAREIISQNFDPLVRALEDQTIQSGLSDKLLHHLLLYFKTYEAESRNISSQQNEEIQSVPIGLLPLLNSNHTISSLKMVEPSLSPNGSSKTSLVKLMRDAGYKCCNTEIAFTDILNQLGVKPLSSGEIVEIIKEEDVAQAIGMMVQTHSHFGGDITWNQSSNPEDIQTWDVEIFATNLADSVLIKSLDYSEFVVNDIKGVEIILNIYRFASKAQENFPLNAFWGRWNNINGQFSFLRRLVQAPLEVFNINDYPVKKVLSLEDFATASANLKSVAGVLTSHPWNSLELVETLIKLADSELFEEIRSLFEKATKQTPEIVCLGLAQVQKPWNTLHQELLNRLISMFLAGHSSSTPVLTRMWQVNSNSFIEGCLEMYNKDNMTISRILDIAQDLKILNPLLELSESSQSSHSFSFSIDLASLASRREYLNLEKYLQDNIIEYGDSFIHECMEFLSKKLALEVARENNNGTQSVKLSVDVVAIFIRILPKR